MNTGNKSILIVEDDKVYRTLIDLALKEDCWDIQQAGDCHTAQTLIERQLPRLVLLDLKLPGMSGMSLLQKLRAKYTREELPVIVVSGHVDETNIVDAIEAGANDYITKPFVQSVLRARVRSTISLHEEHHEQLQRERHEAMLASIGAACHHMAQPLTAALTHLEILDSGASDASEPLQKQLHEVYELVKEAGDILRQMQFVETFKTVQYTDDIELLEIPLDTEQEAESGNAEAQS